MAEVFDPQKRILEMQAQMNADIAAIRVKEAKMHADDEIFKNARQAELDNQWKALASSLTDRVARLKR